MQHMNMKSFELFLMTWKMFKCNVNCKNPIQNRMHNVIHNTKKTYVFIYHLYNHFCKAYICACKCIHMCVCVCVYICVCVCVYT